jgi:hypothetical protein
MKTTRISERSEFNINAFHFSLQRLFEVFFIFFLFDECSASLTLEMRTEMYVYLHVKFPLLLFDFYQIWNESIVFNKTPQYQISRKSDQRFLSYYTLTNMEKTV